MDSDKSGLILSTFYLSDKYLHEYSTIQKKHNLLLIHVRIGIPLELINEIYTYMDNALPVQYIDDKFMLPVSMRFMSMRSSRLFIDFLMKKNLISDQCDKTIKIVLFPREFEDFVSLDLMDCDLNKTFGYKFNYSNYFNNKIEKILMNENNIEIMKKLIYDIIGKKFTSEIIYLF